MALDPRTPVVVGVGQVTVRPDPDLAPPERPEPVELVARALRAAAEDAAGAAPGAPAPAGRALLERCSSLRVVGMLGYRTANVALAVAERLGVAPRELMVSAVGGNMPETLLHDAARAIARGDADVVAVGGAEAMYTRTLATKHPEAGRLHWTTQDPGSVPAPVAFGTDRLPANEAELTAGMVLPIHAYPLFEVARRAAHGWTPAEHRRRIGALWARFSEVAATNPDAWLPEARSAAELAEPGPANRMVAFPYPKLCTANLQVDQAAGYLVCSVEAARAAGVGEDRWVFPLAGADATDHWFVSERPELHRSPAIRLCGAAALALAGVGVDDLGPIDLYSCFPTVVQTAAEELGLALDDPDRPLTCTGGLTFFGGPGNNYTAHGIAAVVGRLRAAPGTVGLVSGLGWYATKHSVGVFASRPPAHEGREGFCWRDVQIDVDALSECALATEATGPVTIETFTVVYGRDEAPERAIVVCRTPEGARAWGTSTEPDTMAELVSAAEVVRPAILLPGGEVRLG